MNLVAIFAAFVLVVAIVAIRAYRKPVAKTSKQWTLDEIMEREG